MKRIAFLLAVALGFCVACGEKTTPVPPTPVPTMVPTEVPVMPTMVPPEPVATELPVCSPFLPHQKNCRTPTPRPK